MNEQELMIKVANLLSLAREGTIRDDQLKLLKTILKENKAARSAYFQIVNLEISLQKMGRSSTSSLDSAYDEHTWEALKYYEQIAPALEVSDKDSQQELIQNIVHPKVSRKISKFNIVSIIASAAAILLLVLFVKFIPEKQYSVEVASLIDQFNVKWADTRMDLESGCRLWTNEPPYILEKGIVSIFYDEGVEVLIEGPAKFEIERSGLFLEYGRLFSHVTESGLGFSVQTPTCQFLDLGTEFGVKSDIDGSSELHVIKGKIQLFAGNKSSPKISQILEKNTAVRFDAVKGRANAIAIKKTAFVRKISSESRLVWRGENLSLADIVGGGNGRGTGIKGRGVDLKSGEIAYEDKKFISYTTGFSAVSGNPLIDAVFIPDGGLGPVKISTTDLQFSGFGDTDGLNYANIFNQGETIYYAFGPTRPISSCPSVINGIQYGKLRAPSAIYMHSNAGITFDLAAIRKSLGGAVSVSRFRALAGIPDGLEKDVKLGTPSVDFRILVDGKKRFQSLKMQTGESPEKIDFQLAEHERFLTLVVTDGSDGSAMDLALFADPVLILIPSIE